MHGIKDRIKNISGKEIFLPVGIIFIITALVDLSFLSGINKDRFITDKIISVIFWTSIVFFIFLAIVYILSILLHHIDKTEEAPFDELEKNNQSNALKITVIFMMVFSLFYLLTIGILGYKGVNCNPVGLAADTILLFNGLGFSVYYAIRLFQKKREQKYIEKKD